MTGFTHSENVQKKRDFLYTLQSALDLLGVALAEHGHEWSANERSAYERATASIQREQEHLK